MSIRYRKFLTSGLRLKLKAWMIGQDGNYCLESHQWGEDENGEWAHFLSRKVEWEEERSGPRESQQVSVREELRREEAGLAKMWQSGLVLERGANKAVKQVICQIRRTKKAIKFAMTVVSVNLWDSSFSVVVGKEVRLHRLGRESMQRKWRKLVETTPSKSLDQAGEKWGSSNTQKYCTLC